MMQIVFEAEEEVYGDVVKVESFRRRHGLKQKFGHKICKEKYVLDALRCPFPKHDLELIGRACLVVPTGTTLDAFGKLFEMADGLKGKYVVVLLGTVLERLAQDHKMNAVDRCRRMMRNSGNGIETIYLPNQFMLDRKTNKVLDSVLEALIWIRSHIDQYKIPLVTVSENVDFQELARGAHFQVMNGVRFFSEADDRETGNLARIAQEIQENLVDLPSATSPLRLLSWDAQKIEAGLRSGDCVQGKLEISQYNQFEFSIRLPGSAPDHTMILQNRSFSKLFETLNHGIHGDEVVFSKDQGRVVAVTKRNWRPYVAVLSHDDQERLLTEIDEMTGSSTISSSTGKTVGLTCIPMDSRIPKIRITTRQPHLLLNQQFVVTIDDWPAQSKYPMGHYTRTLGSIGEISTEALTIMVETGLENHLSDFPPKAMSCLPSNWKARPGNRRDLRESHLIFSVDPPGCQDIDDAMSFRKLDDTFVEVGVHIADVTSFVTKGSALDVEAARRATSVYLQDRRLDMLPRLLCEDLCSLRPWVDRYAVSVIWKLRLTADAGEETPYSVEDVWMGRTLIRSAHALSYGQAQNLIDGREPGVEKNHQHSHTGKPVDEKLWDLLHDALIGLSDIAQRRAHERNAQGALQLDGGGEFKFSLDASHRPSEVQAKKELAIHGTVAELMIFANEYVAREIVKKHPQTAVLRIHAKPPTKKLGLVLEMAENAGITMDVRSNQTLAHSMSKAREQLDDVLFAALNDALIRAMSEAQYICAGLSSDYGHFGLGIDFYTHFTSPIRRYADVMVHRHLLDVVDDEKREEESKSSATMQQDEQQFSLPVDDRWAKVVKNNNDDEDILFGGVLETNKQDNDGDDFLDDLLGESEQQQKEGDGDDFLDDLLGERRQHDDNDVVLDDILLQSGANQIHQESSQEHELKDGITLEAEQVDHINKLHRAAKEASFRSNALFFTLYFQRNPQLASAIVIGIRKFGLLCFVPSFQLKVLMRFDPENSHIVVAADNDDQGKGKEQQELKTVECNHMSFHFHENPHGKNTDNEYGSVDITPLEPGHVIKETMPIRLLDRVTGYLCCEDTWDTKIPKPKLLYYVGSKQAASQSNNVSANQDQRQNIKDFAKMHSPMRKTQNKKQPRRFLSRDSTSLYQVYLDPSSSSKSKAKPQQQGTFQVVAKRGRFIYNNFHSREASQIDETQFIPEFPTSSTSSFSAIQHDRLAVARFAKDQEKDATRRMNRLLAAKRETKIKNRKKANQ